MTGNAGALEDPARWIGVVIAFLGALAANPDATAHGWLSFWAQARSARRSLRGFLARFISALRHDVTIHAGSAIAGTVSVHGEASGRAIVAWGADATVDHMIEVLDQRTRSLDKEVGELQQSLRQTEKQLKSELSDAVDGLRAEAGDIRKAVEDLRLDIVRSDASALPIIVVGVVLSGLAPDAASVPLLLGLLALVSAVVLACWLGWRIFRPGVTEGA